MQQDTLSPRVAQDLTLITRLDTSECARRLRQRVVDWTSRRTRLWTGWPGGAPAPVRGWVGPNRFWVFRLSAFPNPFATVLYGELVPNQSGTRILIHAGLHPWIRWLGVAFAILAGIPFLAISLSQLALLVALLVGGSTDDGGVAVPTVLLGMLALLLVTAMPIAAAAAYYLFARRAASGDRAILLATIGELLEAAEEGEPRRERP